MHLARSQHTRSIPSIKFLYISNEQLHNEKVESIVDKGTENRGMRRLKSNKTHTRLHTEKHQTLAEGVKEGLSGQREILFKWVGILRKYYSVTHSAKVEL